MTAENIQLTGVLMYVAVTSIQVVSFFSTRVLEMSSCHLQLSLVFCEVASGH